MRAGPMQLREEQERTTRDERALHSDVAVRLAVIENP
jgi:hypothetical protein